MKRETYSKSNENITTDWKRHLGPVIGSNEYWEKYVKDLFNDRNNQLALSNCPHEIIYYFMRTIPGISQFLDPLKEAVRNRFIPAITKSHICLLLTFVFFNLLRWVCYQIFHEITEGEFENSRKITSELTPLRIN